MNDVCIPIHADSGRCKTVEPQTMTITPSYLPGHITITLHEPTRMVVVERAKLEQALKSI